jgi:hypothetical protein
MAKSPPVPEYASVGCDALPLEPTELAEAWQDNVREMAERFLSIGK